MKSNEEILGLKMNYCFSKNSPAYYDVMELMDEARRDAAIGFADWRDSYMNNPPVGTLPSNSELYSLYLNSINKTT